MRTESKDFIVIERPGDLYLVKDETPSGEVPPRLLFDFFADIPLPPPCASAEIDDISAIVKSVFGDSWKASVTGIVGLDVRSGATVMAADPDHSLSSDAKLTAVFPDLSCARLIAAAMGKSKAAKIQRAYEKHRGPLVYLSNWDITLMAIPARLHQFSGWKLSERGYVCTEEQAIWVACKEREVLEKRSRERRRNKAAP